MELRIDLQDGFYKDRVEVYVEGREVLSEESLSTRFQTGFAKSISVEISVEVVSVRVTLPDRELDEKIRFEPRKAAYLGVSLDPEHGLRFRSSSEPFGYL